GATVVLIAMHEGDGHGTEPLREMLERLPRGTIDGIVSGHTHLKVSEFVADVPVIQAGVRGYHFARFDLFVDRATGRVNPDLTKMHGVVNICGTWFANGEECYARGAQEEIEKGKASEADFFPLRKPFYEEMPVEPDLVVRKALAPYLASANKIRGEVLGHAHGNFGRHDCGENDVGQLFVKSYAEAFPDARVIYMNGGGFRRMLNKGPVTYGDLFEVNPFDNFVVKVRLTGRELRRMLEVGFSGVHTVPQIHGVRVKFHGSDHQSQERDLNGDGRKEKWERNRIESLTWENGSPVNDQETFWLVTSDFLVMGGDNMDAVFDSIPESRRSFQDVIQRDVVAEWLRKNPSVALPLPYQPRVEMVR
ncbi:MAG: bifunctional metallophosphatase/5'-nucleotidase, partial [Bdellovibrionales bacterium]|nr:bifunctional metallophosphatase/5'-nucleotidase [Bdellovibrionales bacterium]